MQSAKRIGMRKRTLDAGGLREIGTGLQMILLIGHPIVLRNIQIVVQSI